MTVYFIVHNYFHIKCNAMCCYGTIYYFKLDKAGPFQGLNKADKASSRLPLLLFKVHCN